MEATNLDALAVPRATSEGACDVTAELTDDVLVDIILRMPVKSVCRCKAVSTRWRDLISHPEHRKKLPQTLAGFFYQSYNAHRFPKSARYFTNVSGNFDPDIDPDPLIDPALSFLPEYKSIDIVDSCNGLLLCRCWKKPTETMDYVVCNPATEKLVVVPESAWSSKGPVARLGFDPAVSSHFHVFEFIKDDDWYTDEEDRRHVGGLVKAVAFYSSKTGDWGHNENRQLDYAFAIPRDSRSVLFNGVLHLAAFNDMVVAVDMGGNVLRGIPIPAPPCYADTDVSDIHMSQGELYFADPYGCNGSELAIWVLEDYAAEKWTLKHNVSHLELFGPNCAMDGEDVRVIAIHPEQHNMVFMVCGMEKLLMSYDMDRKELRLIRQLGRHCSTPYTPYVPLFLDSLADAH